MYTLYKEFSIDCAHVVHGHPGKCAREHGHTYRFEIWITGSHLNDIGILVDFGDIKKLVDGKYDHRRLNDFPEFDINQGGKNPTAEVIAEQVARDIVNLLPSGAYLDKVRVWETPTCYAEYKPTLNLFNPNSFPPLGPYYPGWGGPIG